MCHFPAEKRHVFSYLQNNLTVSAEFVKALCSPSANDPHANFIIDVSMITPLLFHLYK